MKKIRFNEEQIIRILQEQESGVPTAELCRRHGIAASSFYKWKAKYGGMDTAPPSKSNLQIPMVAGFRPEAQS